MFAALLAAGISTKCYDGQNFFSKTHKVKKSNVANYDDGGSGDLGYPWSCLTGDGRVLVVYYFNREGGVRHIAGTFLELDG